MKTNKKIVLTMCMVLIGMLLFSTIALASGDVAGAIEGTWKDASGQIKTVVNKVVFPAIDLILAVFFLQNLVLLILITGSMDNLNGQHQLFYLHVWYLL